MLVRQLMHPAVITIGPGESVALAARLLHRHNIGALPVCSPEGRLRGILTDRDIVLRCIASGEDPDHTPVAEIMTRRPLTLVPSDRAEDAAAAMAKRQIRRLPVTENGRLVGLVALADLARQLNCRTEAAAALCEISTNIQRR